MNLAKRLRFMRLQRAESIKEVSDAIGLSYYTYRTYENGHIPNDDTKIKIARHFGTTVGWLFFDEGNPPDIKIP